MNLKRFLFTALTLALLIPASAQSLDSFFTQSDIFFKTFTKDGKVDYKGLHNDMTKVAGLYQIIGATSLEGKSDNEKIAFHINAYNLIVIHQVAKYYPLKSVLNRSGFFNAEKHLVAGEKLTLDEIEKVKTIGVYKDPRVHFAFSCAATGCPQLASFGFEPTTLNTTLDSRTKRAVNNSDFTKVDDQKKRVYLSKIFEWYAKDFTTNGDVITYLNKYRAKKIPSDYKVSYYEYDWNLNEL